MADLTTTITESVTLNSTARGSTNTKTTSGVNDVYERVITVPTSEVTLYSTHATVPQGGVFDKDLVKYVRVTNLDSSNFTMIRVSNTPGDEFYYKLNAGESFILHSHDGSMNATQAATATSGAGLDNITDLTAEADTDAVKVEVFVASA